MKDDEKLIALLEKHFGNDCKYTVEYFRKYGFDSGLPFNRGRTESEKIYKECLEKGVRWEDILGKPDKDMFY